MFCHDRGSLTGSKGHRQFGGERGLRQVSGPHHQRAMYSSCGLCGSLDGNPDGCSSFVYVIMDNGLRQRCVGQWVGSMLMDHTEFYYCVELLG